MKGNPKAPRVKHVAVAQFEAGGDPTAVIIAGRAPCLSVRLRVLGLACMRWGMGR